LLSQILPVFSPLQNERYFRFLLSLFKLTEKHSNIFMGNNFATTNKYMAPFASLKKQAETLFSADLL